MLQLINLLSQTADLYPDTSIPIERNNPLFNEEDQLFADITYGFKLPLTPNNLEFIKNGHLIESSRDRYTQEATLLADGTPFHKGVLTYKITGRDIDALFKINYGALSEKARTVKLSEIYTADAMYNPYNAIYMKQTCEQPKNYPYCFFPVYNELWNETTGEEETRLQVNQWDHAAQAFTGDGATSPYFKLKSLLVKTMRYLGFQVDGDWLADPASEQIYVYTRFFSGNLLNGSFTYLPQDLTIADFLIRVKERFKISCNFDMITGKVIIQSPEAALNNSAVQKIKEYVTSVDGIETTEAKGYSIILKPDEGDELFRYKNSNDDDPEYIPSNRLVIGNGEKEIEMESSTLKTKVIADYSMPATRQHLYFTGNKSSSFPLRFLKYTGMKAVAGGKVFPQAEPMELTLDDATWYKFLNEAKVIKLKITIPASELARLKVYQRISFLSAQGNYTIALLEKLSYNLTSSNSSYIQASIQCRAMVSAYASDAQITEYAVFDEIIDEDPNGLIPPSCKAYFDSTIPYVDFQLRYRNNLTNGNPGRAIVQSGRITKTTDTFGTGGTVITTRLVLADNFELRVLTGVPLYIIYAGVKVNFTQGDGYYYINMYTIPRVSYDGQAIWIVYKDIA